MGLASCSGRPVVSQQHRQAVLDQRAMLCSVSRWLCSCVCVCVIYALSMAPSWPSSLSQGPVNDRLMRHLIAYSRWAPWDTCAAQTSPDANEVIPRRATLDPKKEGTSVHNSLVHSQFAQHTPHSQFTYSHPIIRNPNTQNPNTRSPNIQTPSTQNPNTQTPST